MKQVPAHQPVLPQQAKQVVTGSLQEVLMKMEPDGSGRGLHSRHSSAQTAACPSPPPHLLALADGQVDAALHTRHRYRGACTYRHVCLHTNCPTKTTPPAGPCQWAGRRCAPPRATGSAARGAPRPARPAPWPALPQWPRPGCSPCRGCWRSCGGQQKGCVRLSLVQILCQCPLATSAAMAEARVRPVPWLLEVGGPVGVRNGKKRVVSDCHLLRFCARGPLASSAALAKASVQPVPWLLEVLRKSSKRICGFKLHATAAARV